LYFFYGSCRKYLAATVEPGAFCSLFTDFYFLKFYVDPAMSEENASVNPVQPAPPQRIPGIVKLVPVLALPLALPLVLHAVHGIALGGIGALAASLALGPKGKDLIKSSGAVLYKMLPVAGKSSAGKEKEPEITPTPFP